MADIDDVLNAAEERAVAMAGKDEACLRALLHPRFSWISHKGDWFDLESYLDSNRLKPNYWYGQELQDAEVRVVGDTAILRCLVVDRVDVGGGEPETFAMSMTQTWVRENGRWLCLAGHAGPRVNPTTQQTHAGVPHTSGTRANPASSSPTHAMHGQPSSSRSQSS